MAQKIEFIRASDLDSLAKGFNTFAEGYSSDLRFIITPIGVVKDDNDYVLVVRVEATHKRRFEDKEAVAPGSTLTVPRTDQ